MATVLGVVLFVARVVSLLVAFSITVTSYRAYRRTGDATFRYTMVGFALLTVGVGVESFLIRVVSLPIVEVHTIESVLFAVGLAVLYVSLNGRPGG